MHSTFGRLEVSHQIVAFNLIWKFWIIFENCWFYIYIFLWLIIYPTVLMPGMLRSSGPTQTNSNYIFINKYFSSAAQHSPAQPYPLQAQPSPPPPPHTHTHIAHPHTPFTQNHSTPPRTPPIMHAPALSPNSHQISPGWNPNRLIIFML